jgi:hypothetical protein
MRRKGDYNQKDRYIIAVVSLHSPKEKVWGLLLGIDQTGIWLHGIDINSFDDWSRQVALRKDASMGLSTMFFPMIRIEKIIKDDDVGSIKSFRSIFSERTGIDVKDFIKLSDLEVIPFIKF